MCVCVCQNMSIKIQLKIEKNKTTFVKTDEIKVVENEILINFPPVPSPDQFSNAGL